MSEKLIASSVADALEAEYLAVANGQKKPGKLDLQTLVRAVQCIRELESASQPGGGEAEPKRGEIWHARLKGAQAVFTAEIVEVTPATVMMKRPNDYYETRYVKSDVQFVERAAPSAGNGGAEGDGK